MVKKGFRKLKAIIINFKHFFALFFGRFQVYKKQVQKYFIRFGHWDFFLDIWGEKFSNKIGFYD